MKVFLVLLCTLVADSAAAQRALPGSGVQPIRVTQSAMLEFPDALARMHPSGGEGRLLVTIRADGELTEWLVIGYSALPFKGQVEAALKELKFAPARRNGETITARTEVVLRFEARGVLISLTTPDEVFSALTPHTRDRGDAYRAFPLSALDQVPVVLQTVSPHYPKELADRGVAGSVTVDFYIDEEGVVRMASVLEAEPAALADAAVNAIRQWRFESPRRAGKPVLAHGQQIFHFGGAGSSTASR